MKKILLVAAAAAGLASIAPAFAADGTVNISGSVTTTTCTVAASGMATVTVALPTVQASALSGLGQIAGNTPFAINVSNCAGKTASAYFEPNTNVDAGTNNLRNTATASPATNVQVRLLNADFSQIALSSTLPAQAPKTITIPSTGPGTGTLNYYAQYYATGAATAGAVSTAVQFTMQYL